MNTYLLFIVNRLLRSCATHRITGNEYVFTFKNKFPSLQDIGYIKRACELVEVKHDFHIGVLAERTGTFTEDKTKSLYIKFTDNTK